MASPNPDRGNGWVLEAWSRLVQIVIRGHLFDAPGLLAFRTFVLRRMFQIEPNVLIGARFYFIRPHGFATGSLRIGRGSKLNHNVEIDYSGGVSIGRDVWISQNVLIETHTHKIGVGPKENWSIERSELVVGDEVWIGANVVVLPGVRRIGLGAVVGAGSVVTKDVADWTIVAGAPAREIGTREPFNPGHDGV